MVRAALCRLPRAAAGGPAARPALPERAGLPLARAAARAAARPWCVRGGAGRRVRQPAALRRLREVAGAAHARARARLHCMWLPCGVCCRSRRGCRAT